MRTASTVLVLLLIALKPANAIDPQTAARQFKSSLTRAETSVTFKAYSDGDRTAYRLTPGQRGGLALRTMKPETRAAALTFLRAFFSPYGMAVIQGVFDREARLAIIEEEPDYRHPENYYLAIFGEPGGGPWGFRFEGHHLSLNLSLDGGSMTAVTPVLLGANPKEGPSQGPDPLGAFLSHHENVPAFLNEVARMFRDKDRAALLLKDAELDTGGFGVWGHPHMEVTGPFDFGRRP